MLFLRPTIFRYRSSRKGTTFTRVRVRALVIGSWHDHLDGTRPGQHFLLLVVAGADDQAPLVQVALGGIRHDVRIHLSVLHPAIIRRAPSRTILDT